MGYISLKVLECAEQDLLKMVMGGGFEPPPEVLEIFKAKGGGSMGLADKASPLWHAGSHKLFGPAWLIHC